MTTSRGAQEKPTSPRTEDEERFHGMLGAWDDDENPLPYMMRQFADSMPVEFRGWAEVIRGWAHRIEREAATATPSLGRLRAVLTMVGDAIEGSLNDIGLGTPDRLERASIRLATAWNRAHAMAWPESDAPYEGDARLDEGSATPDPEER